MAVTVTNIANSVVAGGTEISLETTVLQKEDTVIAVISKDDDTPTARRPPQMELIYEGESNNAIYVEIYKQYIKETYSPKRSLGTIESTDPYVKQLFFDDTGLFYFVRVYGVDTVYKYSIDTEFDIYSNPTLVQQWDMPAAGTFTLSPDGLHLITKIVDTLKSYTFTQAFDLDTLVAGGSFYLNSPIRSGYVINFSPDGQTFFTTFRNDNIKFEIAQWNVPIGWDVGSGVTQTHSTEYTEVWSQWIISQWSPDGMVLIGREENYDRVHVLLADSPFDSSSLVHQYYVPHTQTSPGWHQTTFFAITPDGGTIYASGRDSNYNESTLQSFAINPWELDFKRFWSGDSEEYIASLLQLTGGDYASLSAVGVNLGTDAAPISPVTAAVSDDCIICGFSVDGDSTPLTLDGQLTQVENLQSSSGSGSVGHAIGSNDSVYGQAFTHSMASSDEWLAWSLYIQSAGGNIITANIDLQSAISELSITGEAFGLISGNLNLHSEPSFIEIEGKFYTVISGNLDLQSTLSKLYLSNLIYQKYGIALTHNISPLAGVQQEKTLFKAYINGVEFPLTNFALRIQSTQNISTGIKSLNCSVISITKSHIDFIKQSIGSVITINATYYLTSGAITSKEIYTGTLETAYKADGVSITLMSSAIFVTNQNVTHYKNNLVYKTENMARIPMDVLISMGDYIVSNFTTMRIKSLTHYFYAGQTPFTEMSRT